MLLYIASYVNVRVHYNCQQIKSKKKQIKSKIQADSSSCFLRRDNRVQRVKIFLITIYWVFKWEWSIH